ncbi:transcriptional repressor LexA [bacterium]|nr:transcriptional repressor LexA [bacterium]
MTKELTRRQEKLLDLIKKNIERFGYPPTIREMAKGMGCSSTKGVRDHLKALERKGYLEREPSASRGVRLLDSALRPKDMQLVPLLGRVPAGEPIEAIEDMEKLIQLDKRLRLPDRTFALKVEGNSMVEADIRDGDYVLVRPQPAAENGEIVVALIGEEGTIKKFYKRNDKVELRPANPKMKPIFCKDVRIVGKIVGMMRRF